MDLTQSAAGDKVAGLHLFQLLGLAARLRGVGAAVCKPAARRRINGRCDLAVEHDGAELQELHQVGHIVYANDDGYIHQHQLYFSSA